MKQCNYSREALFQLNGIPPLGMSISLALQHLVAMIVGCVTPAIIIANALGLPQSERVLLIQVSLVMSAVTTLIELFPIGGKLGSGLPVMFGISFAYLPSMQAIVGGGGDIATIAGAMVVGGIVAAVVGVFVKKIRRFFPPIITGTVVFTIGLSLYPTAINYMAGGAGNTYEVVVLRKGLTSALVHGSWQNWAVAAFTLIVVMVMSNKGKGICKLAAILLGMIAGYIVAAVFGMVDLSEVRDAAWFSLPQFMHFGIKFEFSACIALALLFAINAIQAIGDLTATTVGGLNREPTDQELQGGIVTYGLTNVLSAFFGSLPTATYSQNVGIVTTNKVVNRVVFALAGGFLLLVGGLCGKTAFDAGRIRTAEETEAVTEDAAVAQTERTAESMQIQKTCRYLLRMDDDGILKVYEADGITLLFETNIRAERLSVQTREQLSNGIPVDDERELYDLLESYSS